jgi:FlaA1/EpsC-like NDP-sugar epimerase
MTRFFLTKRQMADLVLGAVENTQGGEVFLHEMVAMRIEDLAEVLISELAPKFGYEPAEIGIELIGARVGETLHEEVVTEREASRTVYREPLYAVQPEATDGSGYLGHDGLSGFERPEDVVRSSEDAELLDRPAIADVLERAGALEVSA